MFWRRQMDALDEDSLQCLLGFLSLRDHAHLQAVSYSMHRACARFQARVWTDQAVSERLWRHERLVMRDGVGSAEGPWLCDSREACWRIRFREWGVASKCIECTVAVRTTGDAGLLPAKCRLAALALVRNFVCRGKGCF